MTPLADPKPRCWFEQWRAPGEFYRAADNGLSTRGKEVVSNEDSKFLQSQDQYLCDAYHAGCFARIWRDDQGPCEVRLMPRSEERPDAQLRPECGDDLDIEITMALKKGYPLYKKIEELYRAKSPQLITTSHEECQESAREAIKRVIRKKVSKCYSESTTLFIITGLSLRRPFGCAEISCDEMKRLTEPGKACFRAIYLLCGMDILMTWPELRVLRGKEPF